VQKLLKSVKICESHWHKFAATILWTTVYIMHVVLSELVIQEYTGSPIYRPLWLRRINYSFKYWYLLSLWHTSSTRKFTLKQNIFWRSCTEAVLPFRTHAAMWLAIGLHSHEYLIYLVRCDWLVNDNVTFLLLSRLQNNFLSLWEDI